MFLKLIQEKLVRRFVNTADSYGRLDLIYKSNEHILIVTLHLFDKTSEEECYRILDCV